MIRGEFDHGWPYWPKETMALKPLGHRVLIRPDDQPEQSEGGLVLPQDHDHVSYSGTVVAVGKGSKMLWEARRKAYVKWLEILDTRFNDASIGDALDEFATWAESEPTPSVEVGDRVAFSAESGLTFTEDGQQYLVMNEDDVVVLVEEEVTA